MILLLDTTVLLDVLRGSPKRRSLLAELVAAGHILSTAAVNIAEVYASMRRGEETRTEAFLVTQSRALSRDEPVLGSTHGRNKAGHSPWRT